MGEFNQSKYINDYNKKNYTRFVARIRNDEAVEILEYIKSTGESKNEFIKKAIQERIKNGK